MTHVFSRARELYVHAYQQVEHAAQPLLAFTTLYANGEKVLVEITEAAPSRLRTKAIRFSVPLGKLSEGEHRFEVAVIDTEGRRESVW